jgi:hypothetical protein
MKLETLYKRTKTGDVQFWQVETTGEVLTKTSGRLGTPSPTIYQETVKGKNLGKKNETTGTEQALFDAQSDWRRKKDEGYKSLEDLNIKTGPNASGTGILYFYSDNGVRSQSAELAFALEARLPKFNTDASGNVKPMLSKDWEGGGKLKWPQLIEKKLDGVRSLCMIGSDGKVQFLSRSGKGYTTVGHLVTAIEQAGLQPGTILDGELYYHGWTLEEVNEAVKKHRPGITEMLEFWVFDLPLSTEGQQMRSAEVKEIVRGLGIPQVKVSEFQLVSSVEEAKSFHDQAVQDGFEGAMLKTLDGKYHQGARSSDWRKMKAFDDTEFEITGYELGQRGVEDLGFICKTEAGDNFGVKLQGSRDSKQRVYTTYITTELYKGKKLTVKHFGYSKYNIPNLPIGKAIREE